MSASVAITSTDCRLQARAWWGEQLLADSTRAIVVAEDGKAPALYFPLDDVRVDLLSEAGSRRTDETKGSARSWTIPGSVAPAIAGTWGAEVLPPSVDGTDAAWSFDTPAPGLEWLAGLVTFDHDRVRVELVDAMHGTEPRDVTAKRFPIWGDAADLISLMRVRPDGPGRFVAEGLYDPLRPVVEGSQMLGQAMVAAGQLAPGRRLVSAHMVFLRGADSRLPLHFELEELSSGRTFASYGVRVRQGERQCAAGTLLLDAMAPDLVRHSAAAPTVTGPYDSPVLDMGVTGRDIRVVEGAYNFDPAAPVGPPIIDAWVRFAEVGDDQALHAGLLAQFTGHLSIGASLRPHAGIGEAQAHRTISTGINAISIAIHAPIDAESWMLYRHLSTFAGDGMTHSECRVHAEDGALVASFSVEAMVRAFADPGRAVDPRNAM